MQRKTVLIAAATALVSAALETWAVVGGQAGIQYRTAAVEHGDINVVISSTGNPNAVVTVQVGTQVSGVVLALFADFNTKVTRRERPPPTTVGALRLSTLHEGKAVFWYEIVRPHRLDEDVSASENRP